MLIAAALPYSPMTNEMRKRVFDISRSELLTIRGIRSLSPNSDQYHGMTIGNHQERERAYHQGTVFPWLICFYSDLAVKVHGKSSLPYLEDFYNGFEPVIKENGIGSISEIYDGDPPHEARGCISQSTSVAALLYLNHVIMNLRGKENAK
jgi:Glycogen debranching enzyme